MIPHSSWIPLFGHTMNGGRIRLYDWLAFGKGIQWLTTALFSALFSVGIGALSDSLKHHGLMASIFDLLVRATSRVFYFKLYACMVLDLDKKAPQPDPKSKVSVIVAKNEKVLDPLFDDTNLDLQRWFAHMAFEQQHECRVAKNGNTVLGYCWISDRETWVVDGMHILFPKNMRYVYKAFTHPAQRGRGVLSVCVRSAVKAYAGTSVDRFITIIETNNFSSIRAFSKAGFRQIGYFRAMRVLGRVRISAALECKKLGIEITVQGGKPFKRSGTHGSDKGGPTAKR
jgi:hypothetical protein